MVMMRVEYSISDEAAFLSHLELMKAFERGIRRAKVPLAFSEGFNPHPKLSIGAPLAVGMAGKHEFLDLELRLAMTPAEFKEKMNQNLPSGIEILRARIVSNVKPLMAVINAGLYRVELDTDLLNEQALKEGVANFLSQESVIIERKTHKGNKLIEVRKGVYDLKIAYSVLAVSLEMLLKMGNDGNVRPEEVVRAIFAKLPEAGLQAVTSMVRSGIFIYENGQRISPMNFGSEEFV